MDAPLIEVRPEHVLDRLAATIGFNDLDFESVEFSDAFHVKAEDERFAYALFDPNMIELMLRRRPPEMHIGRGWLAIRGRVWSAGEFEQHLDTARFILEAWPRHLLAEANA